MLRYDKKHSNSPRKIIFGAQIGATVEILQVKNFDPPKMTISGLLAEFYLKKSSRTPPKK